MENIFNLPLEKLENKLENLGEKKFRATQIFEWLYKKGVSNFFDMKNIKKESVSILSENFNIDFIKIIQKQSDKDAKKYLFELEDGNKIEAVLLKQNYGNSLCVSSQVGCSMGCVFCESGKNKRVRNLKPFEIVQQILLIESDLNIRVSHVVVMGIGEPFDNYDNIIDFIKIINHPKGLDIGARHITVSTCGVVPKIYEFAEDVGQINLAISLHAANDELRSYLMPINKAYNLRELMKAVKFYIQKTNRRVTFEYIMLDGVNDSEKHAHELISLIRGINCYVNLIPYNKVNGDKFSATSSEKIMKFYDIIKKNKINVTIRKELGSGVSAACGQLRSEHREE